MITKGDHKDMSSQEIYEQLLNGSKFESSNPYDIITLINDTQKQIEIDNSEEDIFVLGDLCDEDLETIQFQAEEYSQEELFNSLDLYASKFDKTKSIEELLDQILDEDDINAIAFNKDIELKKTNLLDILDSELTPSKDVLEDYSLDYTDEEIYEKIFSIEKKIGSSLQQTIKVYDFYNSSKLLFADEATELSDLIINKLLIYKKIIIDFDRIYDITDVFLREAFNRVCKFLSTTEFMEYIDIINIDDKVYVNLIKEIVPGLFKYWLNTNENIYNTNKEKEDLIRQLDPESKIYLDNPNLVKAVGVPFERLNIPIGKRREKKLRYPIWFVERITEEVISVYSLDEKIFNYLEEILPIEMDDLFFNAKIKYQEDYKYLIADNIFGDLSYYCEHIILDACDNYLKKLKLEIDNTKIEIKELKDKIPNKFITAGGVCFQNLYLDDKLLNSLPAITKHRLRKIEDLEFQLLDLEHKYIIKEDILRNVFETIPFSAYNQELDKIKLISYHYLCKYLESKVIIFREIGGPSKVRGLITVLEVFKFDLLNVLCSDSVLRKFIFSMQDLISKWVMKYTFGSRMAKFYFDIMMITPDILTEQILKILAMNVIRNKNPMTLRAIYSSYISLVHLIIDTDINMRDLSKRKYGSFQSLSLFKDASDDRAIVNSTKFKISFEEECLLKIWLYKNPKDLNDNYFLMKRLNLYKFLEVDSLRIYSTKPKDLGPVDWYFYYMNYIRHVEKDQNVVYKIKSKFLKSDKRNSQLKIIEIMTQDVLFETIYNAVLDGECTTEILGVIAEDISMRTINKGYMDTNFNLIVKSNQEYLNYIHQTLIEIKERI